MKTTRIEIDLTTYSPDFQTRRLVVNWKRDGVLHTVESSMLEDTAPPEKVAFILRELAHKISEGFATHPSTYRSLVSLSSTFSDDVLSVHRANFITAYQLWLDCNLPGEQRRKHLDTARLAGYFLAARLNILLGDFLIIPTVFF